MKMNDLILGIDTSNYTTSLALADIDGTPVADARRLLDVKPGERGLRQSDALYKHMENMPELAEEILLAHRASIKAVCASDRPRPAEGSYMPVFKAGVRFGQIISQSLNVPFYTTSHQEGHLMAAKHGTELENENEFLFWHLSGGTTELLYVDGKKIAQIGGTKDLSYGQLIDRIGVKLGYKFPAGAQIDRAATLQQEQITSQNNIRDEIKPIHINELFMNLSGLETTLMRKIDRASDEEYTELQAEIPRVLMEKLTEALAKITDMAVSKYEVKKILLCGGVASSTYLRQHFSHNDSTLFGKPEYSSDNAIGTALLGVQIWQSNQ